MGHASNQLSLNLINCLKRLCNFLNKKYKKQRHSKRCCKRNHQFLNHQISAFFIEIGYVNPVEKSICLLAVETISSIKFLIYNKNMPAIHPFLPEIIRIPVFLRICLFHIELIGTAVIQLLLSFV